MVFEWLCDCYSTDSEKEVEPIAPKIFAFLRTATTKAMQLAGASLIEAQQTSLLGPEEMENDSCMDGVGGSPSNAASTSETSEEMEESSSLMSPPRVLELEMMEFENCSARLVTSGSTSEINPE
ncbi:hypothetical protein BSKO_10721 [Bryopsis sp. KO-2023]|nr:hypothetical protein BSKO_10721 [Bryopsis sp. KO-2023]